MRKLVYYVGTSIDGYIAGPDHEVDFFPMSDEVMDWIKSQYPETLPTHMRDSIGFDAPNKRFDTVIMGLGTYRPALDIGITSPYQHLRQYVVSTTLTKVPDPEVELDSADPCGVVRDLKGEDGMDIWLAGGEALAASLLSEIDELVVKKYPVVFGEGIAAFHGSFSPALFNLIETRQFDNGTLIASYCPIRH